MKYSSFLAISLSILDPAICLGLMCSLISLHINSPILYMCSFLLCGAFFVFVAVHIVHIILRSEIIISISFQLYGHLESSVRTFGEAWFSFMYMSQFLFICLLVHVFYFRRFFCPIRYVSRLFCALYVMRYFWYRCCYRDSCSLLSPSLTHSHSTLALF